MTTYRQCLSCESSVAPEFATLNITFENKLIACICSDCMTNVKTFKTSFTRDSLTATYTPMGFQCLEVFTKPRNAEIPD